MEYIGEVLSKRDFDQRVKKYSENKAKHFYFMGLGPNEVSLFFPTAPRSISAHWNDSLPI